MVTCSLLTAMGEKRYITVESINRRRDRITENHVVPLRIMLSAQSGRQYVMAFVPRFGRIVPFRTDNIGSVKINGICEDFDNYREELKAQLDNIWGISTRSKFSHQLEHVEFTVKYDDDEGYIHRRLEREKRCGKVEKLDDNTSRFTADVLDASEMIPWMRTFICRITDATFSNKELERQFWEDIEDMYALYGLEGGDEL